LILNKKEGQIDTGKMMQNLLQLAQRIGVYVLNAVEVSQIKDLDEGVAVDSSVGQLKARHVIVATNGFATQLLGGIDVKPARAQVLITKPINQLKLKGTFHYDEGYYYFRNVGKRVLFGGGRNLDFEKETTVAFDLNRKIHKHLEDLLHHIILPGVDFEIEQRWSGIMGVGNEKKPIIQKISNNVVCAVRMGGMGVAIGSLVGKLAVSELIR
jgi:glycine/D-amino acid oxidase-like deaminating enzyme